MSVSVGTPARLVAVEIGGTKLQAALGTSEGGLLDIRRRPVEPNWTACHIVDWVVEAVEDLKSASPSAGQRLRGIGVGFGGPVDSATGRVLTSHQIEGWRGFALREALERKTGLPVRVENDANAAGWAEYVLGAGRGTRTMVYMNIGSGIGGAFICDGRLYNGQGLGAAEIGHTHVPVPAASPGAAFSDKLENLCSGWSIERRARAAWSPDLGGPLAHLTGGDPAKITCALLARAARDGDAFARDWIERAARTLGIAVANAITLLCPERYVIGGGAAEMGEVLFDPLRRSADRHVIDCFRGRCRIVPAALGQDVVLVGALLLAAAA